MYDIQNFRPTNKEILTVVLIVLVFLVGAFSLGYMLGVTHTRENVHDNGDPATGVRTEIDAAGSGISTAKSRIDNAAAAADRVEARISDAQERVEYVKGTADEGRRIIAECQSILRAVRSGGKEKAPQN
jgi:hypothetical protein